MLLIYILDTFYIVGTVLSGLSFNNTVEDHIGHIILQHRLVDAEIGEIVSYIRHIKSADSLGQNHRAPVGVFYLEAPLLYPLLENIPQHCDLLLGNDAAGTVYLSDIAEETGAQRSVAPHDFLHRLEAAAYILTQLLVGGDGACHDYPEISEQLVGLAFYYGVKDLPFALEIGVDGAPTLFRGGGDVVHRRVLHPLAGEKLARHLYEFISCLGYHLLFYGLRASGGKLHTFYKFAQN